MGRGKLLQLSQAVRELGFGLLMNSRVEVACREGVEVSLAGDKGTAGLFRRERAQPALRPGQSGGRRSPVEVTAVELSH